MIFCVLGHFFSSGFDIEIFWVVTHTVTRNHTTHKFAVRKPHIIKLCGQHQPHIFIFIFEMHQPYFWVIIKKISISTDVIIFYLFIFQFTVNIIYLDYHIMCHPKTNWSCTILIDIIESCNSRTWFNKVAFEWG